GSTRSAGTRSVTDVEDQGKVELAGKFRLEVERAELLFRGRPVPVRVEASFPDSHDARPAGLAADGVPHFPGGGQLRGTGVDAHRGPHVRVAGSRGQRPFVAVRIRADGDER